MCGFFLSGYDRERNNKRNWGYVEMKIKNPSTQDILNMDIEELCLEIALYLDEDTYTKVEIKSIKACKIFEKLR